MPAPIEQAANVSASMERIKAALWLAAAYMPSAHRGVMFDALFDAHATASALEAEVSPSTSATSLYQSLQEFLAGLGEGHRLREDGVIQIPDEHEAVSLCVEVVALPRPQNLNGH